MDLDRDTSMVLKYGIAVAICILAVGAIIGAFDEGLSHTVMNGGLAVLIMIPFLSIIVSAVALYMEKDRYWLLVAIGLLVITGAGMAIAWYL